MRAYIYSRCSICDGANIHAVPSSLYASRYAEHTGIDARCPASGMVTLERRETPTDRMVPAAYARWCEIMRNRQERDSAWVWAQIRDARADASILAQEAQ